MANTPAPAAPPEPPPTSKAAVVGGVSGAGALIYLVDRMLADNGELAATMLTRLSPVLGPVWASWPLIALGGMVAWTARDRWVAAQRVHAAEALRVEAAVDAVANGLGEVATGLSGLRAEVASLREDLSSHADATDRKFGEVDASLRAHVQAEIAPVLARVNVLERRRR